MTEPELLALLSKEFIAAPDSIQVSDGLMPAVNAMLSSIAHFVHIDQPGFTRSDLVFMMLALNVLTSTLIKTREELGIMAMRARDVEEDPVNT